MQMSKVITIVPRIDSSGPVNVAKCISQHPQCAISLCTWKEYVARLVFQREKFDVVHSHCFVPDLINYLCKSLGLSNHVMITTMHNIMYADLKYEYGVVRAKIMCLIWLHIVRRFNTVFALNRTAERYYRFHGIKNIRKIHNISLSFEQRPVKVVDPKRVNICFIGRLIERKRPDLLLYQAQYLENASVHYFGTGPLENSLRELANELNVTVKFHGFVANPQRYLHGMDFFFLPSELEGFPVSLIEAIDAGLRVIVADTLIFRDILHNDEALFIDLSSNEQQIDFDKMNNVLGGDQLKASFFERYSKESFFKKLCEAYQTCG